MRIVEDGYGVWRLDSRGRLWFTQPGEECVKVDKGYEPGACLFLDGVGGVWVLDGDGELWHAAPKSAKQVTDDAEGYSLPARLVVAPGRRAWVLDDDGELYRAKRGGDRFIGRKKSWCGARIAADSEGGVYIYGTNSKVWYATKDGLWHLGTSISDRSDDGSGGGLLPVLELDEALALAGSALSDVLPTPDLEEIYGQITEFLSAL